MFAGVYRRVVGLVVQRIAHRKHCSCAKRVTISSILNNDRNHAHSAMGETGEVSHKTTGETGQVIVEGWVRSVRKMKDTIFIDVTDGTGGINGRLQVTASKVIAPLSDLTAGCSLRVQGYIAAAPNNAHQPELRATSVSVVGRYRGNGATTATLPVLPRKTYSNDYLRQHLHLRHRTAKFAAVARLRDRAVHLVHEFMVSREFVHVHTPVLTRNDCEGAGETFQVHKSMEFFDRPVFLSVSGQLHLEAAAHGLGRVYTLNPVFRAENSRSRLHLSEFYMLEAEQAFITDLQDLLRLMEELVTWMSRRMLELAHRDIEVASDLGPGSDMASLTWLAAIFDDAAAASPSFPVLEYDEALRILQTKGLTDPGPSSTDGGLSKEQELALVAHCGQVPMFVINWPRTAKPAVYMKEEGKHSNVLAVDLLAPIVGEMAGGSLREDDYDRLRTRCAGQPNLDWYVALRQFGGAPTAGFGLGFERYLQFLCNISNIKDTILFPRWPHNCAM